MRICIVIVTWNRLNLLKSCIDAARANAAEADILVVDNASTDGTAKWLENQKDIRVLSLPKNIGGAGGFAEGMRFARELGYEWLWVMDDDVVPLPGGMRTLLEYSERYDAIQPTKLDSKGRVWEFEGLLDERSLRRTRIKHARAFAAADAVPCNAACFEGLFFKSALIDRTGLPFADFSSRGMTFTTASCFHGSRNLCMSRRPASRNRSTRRGCACVGSGYIPLHRQAASTISGISVAS